MAQPAAFTWILFDAVGTLIHPSPSVAEAYWTIGRRFGSRLTVEDVDERFEQEFGSAFSGDDPHDLVSSEKIERERWRQIVERVLEDVRDREQCFATVHEHFSQATAWKLFDDVPGILTPLRQAGYKLAIASNFDHRLHDVTRGHDPLSQFDAVLTSAELGFRKPARRFYEEVGSRVQASPSEMLMVGDHPVNDVAAARAAGLNAILIDRDRRHMHEPDRIFSLAHLLEQIPQHDPS